MIRLSRCRNLITTGAICVELEHRWYGSTDYYRFRYRFMGTFVGCECCTRRRGIFRTRRPFWYEGLRRRRWKKRIRDRTRGRFLIICFFDNMILIWRNIVEFLQWKQIRYSFISILILSRTPSKLPKLKRTQHDEKYSKNRNKSENSKQNEKKKNKHIPLNQDV